MSVKPLAPKYIKKIFIRAQSADPSPPLGTVLGNLGVTTSNFCTSFNLFTKQLPLYFLLKVTISIFENKSTSFTVDLPSTGYFLTLLKFDHVIKVRVFDRLHDKTIQCIKLGELLKLARLKFPNLPLLQSF
jgi:ribosomal protein L11